MRPDELRAAVTVTGGALDLDVTSLGSAMLTAYLGDRFRLSDVTDRTDTADGVTVTGTGTSVPFTGLAVTANMAGDGTTVTADITATGDETWTFLDAFPVLANTVFETLRFQTPTLRLDPAAGHLTFTGTLIITTELVLLDLMMGGLTHAIEGQIEMFTEIPGLGIDITPVPDILLYGPEGATLNLGPITVSNLRYEILGDPRMDYALADMTVHGRVSLTGSIPFTTDGVAHEVLIGTDVRGWGESLLLYADLSELGDAAFEEIATLLGQTSPALPDGVSITAPVTPEELIFMISPGKTPMLDYTTLTVQTTEEWDIGLFIIQAIAVTFRVDGAGVTAAVTGLFGVGKSGTLEISAGIGDDVTIGGALRDGDPPLSIREVWQDFTGDEDATHLPDLEVTHFDLLVTLPTGGNPLTARGLLDLVGRWEIVTGVEIDDVEFALDITDTTAFTARATFVVAGAALYVDASYATVQGWEFGGATGTGQQIPVGALADSLATGFGGLGLPAPLAGLTIDDLGAYFSTGTGQFTFTAAIRFPIDTTVVELAFLVDTLARTYGGTIKATVRTGLDLIFGVHYSSAPDAARYAVTYGETGLMPTVRELVGALSPTASAQIPGGIAIGIRDAVLAVEGAGYAFGIDLVATVDLAKLPLIGPRLTGAQAAGFDPLRVLASTVALTAAQVRELNALLPSEAGRLPEQDLPSGFTVGGVLKLGPLEQPMTLPTTPGQPAPAVPAQTKTDDNVLWYNVQTGLGPIQVARVGLAYRHAPNTPATLAILLDASVSVGGLTLSCDGLAVGLSLADSGATPTFDLAGLGVSYSGGPVGITGAFLKGTLRYGDQDLTAYSGKAVLTTETFTLGALGSYAQLDDGPSLFVYAFLDYPIGGPAFFFVTGLAAGFGYNRRFIAPPVDRIADFPLVSEAIGATQPGTLGTEMARLNDALRPSPGDYFLTVGVRFTSFKMIDSFLLVTAGFGHRFELDVLGLSTLVVPAPDEEVGAGAGADAVTPVAEIQLALRAAFAPEDGYFSLLAQLTSNSYLLSKACRLTGGFAFVTWFGGEHSGDFVLTVGGYHPHFTVPSHYPSVPRLGFNWQVSAELAMKGSAYYALTPSALMAGGSLSATYVDDSLNAWFDTSLDFLISWQPYHYEAQFHLSIGASYTLDFFGTHTIHAQIGTDVRFWGPDFGGTATIDLYVISVTVAFGSASGASAAPVTWERFRAAQLPDDAEVVTVALRGGTPQGASGDHLGAVDPATLELVTDSVLPSTGGVAGANGLAGTDAAFGVAPMGVRDGFTITQTITITRDGASAEGYFVFSPLGKDLPAALWGDELTPSLSRPALAENLLTGYTVRPLPPAQAGSPATVPVAALQALTAAFTEENAFDWVEPPPFVRAGDQTLDLSAGEATRGAVAAKLLPGWDVDLHGLTAADFLRAPEVAARG
jgi:hypothetical protein